MKQIIKKLILPALLLIGLCGLLVASPVFAEDDGCVETALFGQVCDDGSGSGITFILKIIVTVLTFGVGIAGTIGIVIAGIQYSSAKDNEQQVAKAKMRIFQIVIGMVIWATLYVALRWLVPGF